MPARTIQRTRFYALDGNGREFEVDVMAWAGWVIRSQPQRRLLLTSSLPPFQEILLSTVYYGQDEKRWETQQIENGCVARTEFWATKKQAEDGHGAMERQLRKRFPAASWARVRDEHLDQLRKERRRERS